VAAAPQLLRLHGAGIAPYLDALAALRIRVFRDWPYLYAGSMDYERQYLQSYLRCPESIVVVAMQGGDCVGATTALPLQSAEPEWQAPFVAAKLPLEHTLYFGESVVLPGYRGYGIGVAFFATREAHARALGLGECSFCAVQRPADHPLRPAGYVGNEDFWHKRGYRPRPELIGHYDWPDLGEAHSSRKSMQYWSKTL
jgi:GNAT superfamily N-acetyltransferase